MLLLVLLLPKHILLLRWKVLLPLHLVWPGLLPTLLSLVHLDLSILLPLLLKLLLLGLLLLLLD